MPGDVINQCMHTIGKQEITQIAASQRAKSRGIMGKKQLILKITDIGTASVFDIKTDLAAQNIPCDMVLIETKSQAAYCYKSDIDPMVA